MPLAVTKMLRAWRRLVSSLTLPEATRKVVEKVFSKDTRKHALSTLRHHKLDFRALENAALKEQIYEAIVMASRGDLTLLKNVSAEAEIDFRNVISPPESMPLTKEEIDRFEAAIKAATHSGQPH